LVQSAAFSYEKIQQTRKIIKEKAVDKYVENPVDNYSIIHQSTDTNQIIVDFHRFIPSIYESFPLFL